MSSLFSAIAFTFFLQLSAIAANPPAATVNVQDYGAIPNDGKDDSAAFQAAFNALDPLVGGTVLCPPGDYDIGAPIVVSTPAVRFEGTAGPAYNEDPPYAGCSLVARTNGMTLLQFRRKDLDHRGPVIEYVNLRDGTPTGHTAVLLDIYNFNRWTARNVTVNYAATGIKVTGIDDASWGYVAQLFCKESNTCIDQSTIEGGFLVLGGGIEPLVTGIRVRGSQVRVVGVKFDCVGGSTGVYITGHAGVVTDSTFEQCGTGILVQNDGSQSWNGLQNRLIGNHFLAATLPNSTGISLGQSTSGNQIIGNTYEFTGTSVRDLGSSNLRLEQGVGADMDLACPGGGAINHITIKQGIVTNATCAPARDPRRP